MDPNGLRKILILSLLYSDAQTRSLSVRLSPLKSPSCPRRPFIQAGSLIIEWRCQWRSLTLTATRKSWLAPNCQMEEAAADAGISSQNILEIMRIEHDPRGAQIFLARG